MSGNGCSVNVRCCPPAVHPSRVAVVTSVHRVPRNIRPANLTTTAVRHRPLPTPLRAVPPPPARPRPSVATSRASLSFRPLRSTRPIVDFSAFASFLFPFPGASSRRSSPVRPAKDVTRTCAHFRTSDNTQLAFTQLCATNAIDTPSPCRLSAAALGAASAQTTSRAPALAVSARTPTPILTRAEVSNESRFICFVLGRSSRESTLELSTFRRPAPQTTTTLTLPFSRLSRLWLHWLWLQHRRQSLRRRQHKRRRRLRLWWRYVLASELTALFYLLRRLEQSQPLSSGRAFWYPGLQNARTDLQPCACHLLIAAIRSPAQNKRTGSAAPKSLFTSSTHADSTIGQSLT